MAILFGIENPLLDISAVVGPEMLQKYNLKENDAILASESHAGIFAEIASQPGAVFIAGGAAQNTLRGAQWLMPANSTVYVGAVGADKEAEILKKAALKDGLRTEYQVTELPTGKCAVLINGIHRSMVTDLQAANAFSIDHLNKPEIWKLVEEAKYFYLGGYFLTVSVPSALKIAEHCLRENKTLIMNVAAPFVAQFFKSQMDEVLPYVQVVVGNEAEAEAFSQSHDFKTTNVEEIALKVSNMPKKFDKPRIVIFTQGINDTVVCVDGKITRYPIIKLAQDKIVDTNGAGDAFSGGFISQLAQGFAIDRCVAAGHYVANKVIQRVGPSYPEEKHSFLFP